MSGKTPTRMQNVSTPEIIDALIHYENEAIRFQREIACFVSNKHGILSLTTDNSAGAVEFDFFGIWEAIKASGERPSHVCMFHTHSENFCHMSSIDENMIHGWRTALGVPVYYFIVSGREWICYLCDKKDGRTFVSVITDEMHLSSDHIVLMDILYGFSKYSHNISNEVLDKVRQTLNKSRMNSAGIFLSRSEEHEMA